MRAVVLLIRLAKLALQARPDLSADTNAVPDLDGAHSVTDLNGLANDFMANADWKRALSPSASNSVDIGATNAAAFDLDVNVTVLELLRLELWK